VNPSIHSVRGSATPKLAACCRFHLTKRQRRCFLTTCGFAATFLLLLVLLMGAAAFRKHSLTLAGPLCQWSNYRLPHTVLPSMYNLTIDVQMEAPYRVEGSVAILVNVTEVRTCVNVWTAMSQPQRTRLPHS
jgi:hypothetical protein